MIFPHKSFRALVYSHFLSSFKTIELDHLSEVPSSLTVPYLLLWDCVLDICSKSLAELRSTYASYLTENGFVQTLLASLFRLMPVEILRSQDAKHIGQAYFAPLSFDQIMGMYLWLCGLPFSRALKTKTISFLYRR